MTWRHQEVVVSHPAGPRPEGPVASLVSYYPKPGSEDAILELLRLHWPTLRRMGLVTAAPPRLWRAFDVREHRTYFVELFEWRDGSASEVAHQTPEVMAIWEPMGPILDRLQIAEVQPLDLGTDA